MRRVDWTTLAATLVGAAIATATSLLTEIRKGRRDAVAEWQRARRDVYVEFLIALTRARSGLLALSKNTDGMTAKELDEKARQVFAPCYELRHQLELFASHKVVEAGLTYFRSVRELRNLVAAGNGPKGDQWERGMEKLKHMRQVVHEAMRGDLSPM